jgi:methanogenic corrinoid protein MtbC1
MSEALPPLHVLPLVDAEPLVVGWARQHYYSGFSPALFATVESQIRRGLAHVYPHIRVSMHHNRVDLIEADVRWLCQTIQVHAFSHHALDVVLSALGARAGSLAGPARLPTFLEVVTAARRVLSEFGGARREIGPGMVGHDRFQRLLTHLVQARFEELQRELQSLLDGGMDAETLFEEIVRPLQYEVGALWYQGRITFAQEHAGTAFLRHVVASAAPKAEPKPDAPVFRVFTIRGEHHAFGAELVAQHLRLHGWDAEFGGPAATAAEIASRLPGERGPALVGLSLAMPQHFARIPELVRDLKAADDLQVRGVLVGGKAFAEFPGFFAQSGADAWAHDAHEVLVIEERLRMNGCATIS